VHRRHRLTANERFQQVRRQGQSREERLVVLIYLPNDLPYSRFGFAASRRVGKAVRRNRARRLLRESVRLQFETLAAGWDMIFIARTGTATATFQQVDSDCRKALRRAGLLRLPDPPLLPEPPLPVEPTS